MKNKYDCFIIGDVILDVFIGSESSFTSFVRGGTCYCDSAKIDFGGAGNVAAALSLLGAKTSFLGKGGDDLWGRLYKKDLETFGVKTRIILDRRASTGLALIVSGAKKERSFCVFRGANNRLTAQEIDRWANLITGSKCLYFSGYSLAENPQRSAVLRAVKLAKKNGLKVIFDPGAHNLIKSNLELFTNLLEICDVFCPNLEEAKAITQTCNMETAIHELQGKGKLIALKRGANGCILVENKKRIGIPAFKVTCLDTTGAGDAFAAALICGLVNDIPLQSIGKLCNWFAAQVTTNIGARAFAAKSAISDFLSRLE